MFSAAMTTQTRSQLTQLKHCEATVYYTTIKHTVLGNCNSTG